MIFHTAHEIDDETRRSWELRNEGIRPLLRCPIVCDVRERLCQPVGIFRPETVAWQMERGRQAFTHVLRGNSPSEFDQGEVGRRDPGNRRDILLSKAPGEPSRAYRGSDAVRGRMVFGSGHFAFASGSLAPQ